MSKTLVIGLDAADLAIIKNNLDKLPNFKRLMESGSYGKMESTIPPVTVPAWPSLFSGLSPDQLGMFEFQRVDFKNYEFKPRKIGKIEEIWDFLDSKVLLNSIPKGPREIKKGYVINSFLREISITPSSFKKEIEGRGFEIEKLGSESEGSKRTKALKNFRTHFNTNKWVLSNKETKHNFTVYRILDTFLHHTQKWKDIKKAYKEVDKALGYFLDNFEGNIFVVSDHGCAKAKKRFYINTWFKRNGFLKVKDKGKGDLKDITLKVSDFLMNLGLRRFLLRLNSIYSRLFGEKYKPNKTKMLDKMDKKKTEVFSYVTAVSNFSDIWINDKRFKNGVVSDKKKVIREIKEKLGGEEEVEWIKGKEEIYESPPRYFPDLIVKFSNDTKVALGLHPEIITKVPTFMHRFEGVFFAQGKDIKQGFKIGKAKIKDFFPTFLHLIGKKVPRKVKGGVLKEIFKKGSEPAERDVEYLKKEEIKGIDI